MPSALFESSKPFNIEDNYLVGLNLAGCRFSILVDSLMSIECRYSNEKVEIRKNSLLAVKLPTLPLPLT